MLKKTTEMVRDVSIYNQINICMGAFYQCKITAVFESSCISILNGGTGISSASKASSCFLYLVKIQCQRCVDEREKIYEQKNLKSKGNRTFGALQHEHVSFLL